jgi:hypothetical protein
VGSVPVAPVALPACHQAEETAAHLEDSQPALGEMVAEKADPQVAHLAYHLVEGMAARPEDPLA